MQREMRLKARKLPEEDALRILKNGFYGVMSTVDGNGCPYGVPVSYVYKDNSIYFHCALEGHKLDNIRDNERVSFCVVGETQNAPSEFTVKYESAIATGKAGKVSGDEKLRALRAIVEKYSGEYREEGFAIIKNAIDKTAIIKISIEYISGKARR